MKWYEQRPYTSNKRNWKLLERFKKIEENEHHDRRQIAWNITLDYYKLQKENKKLNKENEELRAEIDRILSNNE